jgi:hypothetical protein
MKQAHMKFTLFSSLFLLLASQMVYSQANLDLETGVVSSMYNDVRIPNETGTLFSLTDDLQTDSKPFFRLRLGYRFGKKHNLIVLFAPLSLNASGQYDQEIHFNGEDFPAQSQLKAKYTFNSYRITYRYDLKRTSKWIIGIGFTAKIRDAAIKLTEGNKSSEKTNVGFVPIINFTFNWRFAPRWSLLLEGDALASPGGQGRAEDVSIAVRYHMNDQLSVRAGYRILEGGADVGEVYNFAWINYFLIGMTFSF